MKVTVIGSSNIDMFSYVESLPLMGETVGGGRFKQAFGGKGANQALAASRLGAEVSFMTTVGEDSYGDRQISHFEEEGMETDCIFKVAATHSGIALIMVDKQGENCITVCPGANLYFGEDLIEMNQKKIRQSDVILMQAEIPYATVKKAAKIAKDAGVKVVYNPAPVCAVDDEMYAMTDVLIVNERECCQLAKISGNYNEAAAVLRDKGVETVIVTLGSKGCYALTTAGEYSIPSYKVTAVDTVGAGDTFCGAIAVEFGKKKEIDRTTLMFASAASALSVTKQGAQPSIPYREDVLTFIETRS